MYVAELELTDFRSYPNVRLDLEPGPNVFIGPNGQGKTNLLEAIGYLATLSSHRVSSEAALVRAGARRAVIRAEVRRAQEPPASERSILVEVEITTGSANRARLNRSPVARTRDVLGVVRAVVFAPEDLALVKGDPDGRRRFLDELLVVVQPRMAAVRADYDRIVRQRSALLKSIGRRIGSAEADTLAVWDDHLATIGAELLHARMRVTQALAPLVEECYQEVAPTSGTARITYRSSLDRAATSSEWLDADEPVETAPAADLSIEELRDLLLEALAAVRSKELDRGVCLVGPHRDDLSLRLGELPAKGYASHGESWSFALALKLACYRLLSEGGAGFWAGPLYGTDGEPVLLLDDVFAELDDRRRGRLAEAIGPARQVLITAAVPGDVPSALDGARFTVGSGQVHRA